MAMASRTCCRRLGERAPRPARLEPVERFGQARLAQRQGRGLATGGVARLEELGDEREVLLGVDRQQAGEAFGKHLGVMVADPGLEAEEQARGLGPDVPIARAAAIRTSFAGSVIASTSRGSEPVPSIRARAMRPRHARGRPNPRSRPRPARAARGRRLLEDVRPLVLHLVEGLDDGDLGPAELVVLERVDQETSEGRFQIPGQLDEGILSGDLRRRGDDRFDRSPRPFRSSAACSVVSARPRSLRSAASLSSRDGRVAMLRSEADAEPTLLPASS